MLLLLLEIDFLNQNLVLSSLSHSILSLLSDFDYMTCTNMQYKLHFILSSISKKNEWRNISEDAETMGLLHLFCNKGEISRLKTILRQRNRKYPTTITNESRLRLGKLSYSKRIQKFPVEPQIKANSPIILPKPDHYTPEREVDFVRFSVTISVVLWFLYPSLWSCIVMGMKWWWWLGNVGTTRQLQVVVYKLYKRNKIFEKLKVWKFENSISWWG